MLKITDNDDDFLFYFISFSIWGEDLARDLSTTPARSQTLFKLMFPSIALAALEKQD